MSSPADTTELLRALERGDREALGELTERVYGELRRLARRELGRRRPNTLDTTGLVHEGYLRLLGQDRLTVEDRAHFLALAATAMRHVVIDRARKRIAQKRGGGWRRVTEDPDAIPGPELRLVELIALDDALTRLSRFDERLSKVVECRYFGGMTVAETAKALGVAPRTVDRAWERAKAWLYQEIHAA